MFARIWTGWRKNKTRAFSRLSFEPRLEILECRFAPTVTVTNPADGDDALNGTRQGPAGPDGLLTLREAINWVNLGNDSSITFALPQVSVTMGSLPAIHPTVTIDGAGVTITTGGQAIGLCIAGPNSLVKNLAINKFTQVQILLTVGSNGSTVQDCFVGTNHGGTAAAGGAVGIVMYSPGNTIKNNVISGLTQAGISIQNSAANNNIRGNKIGTDHEGTADLGNGGVGISLTAGVNNTTIGGTSSADRNIICANNGGGISIAGTDNKVFGNSIGINADGDPLGNTGDGVVITQGTGNLIGSASAGAGNTIGGNTRAGVDIAASGNKVQGNFIGTNAAGDNLGNGEDGVYIAGSQNVIGAPVGSSDNALGNWIAFNGQEDEMRGNGVTVATGNRNTIRRNHIFMNERLGIDLADDYFDRYRGLVRTAGANDHQWHPTIIGVDGGTISWMFNAPTDRTYTIDVYADPDNGYFQYAEGKTWLASPTPVLIHGHYEFTTSVGTSRITATATDDQGNTSEFSLADEDADGLCDTWEANQGIDLHGDGSQDTTLPDAHIHAKDLYVEYDSMTGWGPVAGVLATAQGVFASQGIFLHLDASDQGIAPVPFGDATHDAWPDFQTVKRANFANHGGPGSDPYIAKLLAYRYCVFGVSHDDAAETSSGRSEILGNDFMVTLGGWFGTLADGHTFRTAAQQDAVSTAAHNRVAQQQVGTFIHEFGHALGLRHTGTQNWDGTSPRDSAPAHGEQSPTYLSVMNYLYQAPGGSVFIGPQVLLYSADEWDNLWFAFQEHAQSSANGDSSTDPADVETFRLPTLAPTVAELVPFVSPALATPVQVGSAFPITFTISNLGPATAVGSVYTLTIPAGLSITSAVASQGTVIISGQTVTATLGSLASFNDATVTVTLTATQGGVFTVSGQVTSATTDGLPGNNTTTATVTAALLTSSINPLPAATSAATFNVSWSGSNTNGPGIASYDIFVSNNGGPFTPFLIGTTQTSASFIGVFGHTYGFYSVAIDSEGHRQTTPSAAQATILLDNTPPTSSMAALPAAFNISSFGVSWSGSDNAGGSGIVAYDVFVSDNGGPFSAFRTGTNLGGDSFQGAFGHTYAFYSIAIDNAGNRQATPVTAQTITLLDNTPPTSTVTPFPAALNSETVNVFWSGNDNVGGSGIAGYTIFMSDNGGPFSPRFTNFTSNSATFVGAFGHTYRFYSVARDVAGNNQPTSGAVQASVYLDGTAPSSSVAALPAGQNTTDIAVSWSGSDEVGGSGIASYDVYASDNGGEFTLFQTGAATSAVFAGTYGHTYGFYSVATDVAGNRQPTPATAQATTLLDNTAPDSTVDPLPASQHVASIPLSWSGSDDEGGSGSASYEVYVSDNGGPFTLFQQGAATSVSFSGVFGHTYGFYSVAIDAAGNRQPTPAAAQAVTLLDGTAPSSTVAPLPASQDSADVALSWSGADEAGGSGLASYDVFVSDNGATFTLFKDDTTDTAAVFPGVYGHTYRFYSVATDHAGNQGAVPASAQATITIANFVNKATFAGGIMSVGGTTGNDTILLAPATDKTKLKVTVNGTVLSQTVALSSIVQIRVFGRDGNDSVTVTNLARPMYFEGGNGTDRLTITGRAAANTFTLGTTSVAVNGVGTGLNSLESLVLNGQKLNDVLNAQTAPAFPVVFNGGAGSDKVQAGNIANVFTLTGAAAGNLNGSISFTAIEALAGGTAIDSLLGPNQNSTWKVSGSGNGAVNAVAFAGVENLTGGSAADTFIVANGKGNVGLVDGGAGRNTLNYAAYLTGVGVNLQAGTADNMAGGIARFQDVYGGAANDVLVGNSLNNLLVGNGGNDELVGDDGNDILIGGAGNDLLKGQGGRDILIGGSGADTQEGGAGDDILVGGKTTFNNEAARTVNVAALNVVLAEWARDLAYSQRVNHLLKGGGLNGKTLLTKATITNDSAIDTLLGESDSDWFVVHAKDLAQDLVAGSETKTVLK